MDLFPSPFTMQRETDTPVEESKTKESVPMEETQQDVPKTPMARQPRDDETKPTPPGSKTPQDDDDVSLSSEDWDPMVEPTLPTCGGNYHVYFERMHGGKIPDQEDFVQQVIHQLVLFRSTN